MKRQAVSCADNYCEIATEFEKSEADAKTTSEVIVTTSLSLPQAVLDKVHAKAAKNGVSPETLIQRWITDNVSSEGLDEMPTNPHNPLFVYGTLKPGELAHQLIANDVERAEEATVQGDLWVRDGVPLIWQDSGHRVQGALIWFKSTAGYEKVCAFEPKSFYQWGSAEADTEVEINVEANVLVPARRLKPDSGGKDVLGEPWRTALDPLLKYGLNTVTAVIRADGLTGLAPADEAPETWNRYYRLQSAYMLACSILERIAFMVFGARLGVTARIKELGSKDKDFVRAVDQVGFRNRGRTVYRSDNPSKPVRLNRSEHFAEWAYQIRSNLMHRGKSAGEEAELVRTALIDLHNILRAYLLLVVPGMRDAWEQSAPELASSNWQLPTDVGSLDQKL